MENFLALPITCTPILIAGLLLLVGAYLDAPVNAKPHRRTTSFAITQSRGAWANTCQTDRRYMVQVVYGHTTIATWGCPSLRFKELYNPEVLQKLSPRQSRLLGPEFSPKY